MNLRRRKLLIINRSFWPDYPVQGDALLNLAELATKDYDVFVILQQKEDIKRKCSKFLRGNGVNFRPMWQLSSSKSSIFWRGFDAAIFMFWVFLHLLVIRPRKIYVSTDPPILVPYVVMLYSRIFTTEYVYHIQDIHPEATSLVKSINRNIFKLLRWMDIQALRNATEIITITPRMAQIIQKRLNCNKKIHLMDNPSLNFSSFDVQKERDRGFFYCGNLGRFQLIPLLLDSIEEYLSQGGKLSFTFAGDGLHSERLKKLSKSHSLITYLGTLDEQSAAELNLQYMWALLPIDDKITDYAFPSKTSSYVCSNSIILAICGEATPVGVWVNKNNLGVVVQPSKQAIVEMFFRIEKENISFRDFLGSRNKLVSKLAISYFVDNVYQIVSRD